MRKRYIVNRKKLLTLGVPAVLIPGILLAIGLGWNPHELLSTKNSYTNTRIFPSSATVKTIVDGDTCILQNGTEVRLLGIDAPGRGEEGEKEAAQTLARLVGTKTVYLEYDRYQDDKYGRILAWVWVDCEGKPVFTPPSYMRETQSSSKAGLIANPDGCKKGILVNEYMVIKRFARLVTYQDRGALKYEERLRHGTESAH